MLAQIFFIFRIRVCSKKLSEREFYSETEFVVGTLDGVAEEIEIGKLCVCIKSLMN